MSRLNKQLRQEMLKTILDHAFLDKQKKAEADLLVAGEALYMAHHEKHLPLLTRLPDSFVYKSDGFEVNIGGQRHNLKLGKKRIVTYESSCSRVAFEANHPIAEGYLRANNHIKDINEQRCAMHREVNSLLESVHTFKKLWEVWPACKTLLEKFENRPTIATLPAVQVTHLNSVLGLPVSEVA